MWKILSIWNFTEAHGSIWIYIKVYKRNILLHHKSNPVHNIARSTAPSYPRYCQVKKFCVEVCTVSSAHYIEQTAVRLKCIMNDICERITQPLGDFCNVIKKINFNAI